MRQELTLSRAIVIASAVLAVAIVGALTVAGFTVADFAFAIYGAALGMVPPVLATLYVDRERTARLSVAATIAVAGGFTSCWTAAAYGRLTGNANIVFLSPLVSIVVATLVMLLGGALTRSPRRVTVAN